MASASTVRSIASSSRRSLAAALLALAAVGAGAQPRTPVRPPLQSPVAPAPALPSVQAPAPAPLAPTQLGPAPLAPAPAQFMAAPGMGWNAVRGEASHIAIADSGEVFAAAKDGSLWQWVQGTTEWTPLPGRGVRLAAGPARVLWTVERDGTLARYFGGRAQRLGVKARDVAVDASGNVLLSLADGGVARLAAGSREPAPIPGIERATRIAVHSDNSVWVVREDQTLARHDGQAWRALPGQANDIAIARSGAVLIAAADGTLQRWDAGSERWQVEPSVVGVAIVAAAPDGTPWVANAAGAMLTRAPVKPGALALAQSALASTPEGIQFKRGGRGGTMGVSPRAARASMRSAASVTLVSPARVTDPAPFEFVDTLGTGSRLAIGQDGSVFAVGLDGNFYRWSNLRRAFVEFPGQLARIAVDPAGNPWGINQSGRIFRHTGTDWRQVRGTASDIAIGANGSVMIASASGVLGRYDPSIDGFVQVPGELYFIAVAPDGTPWGLLKDGTVLRCRTVPCDRVGFEARNIAIGPDGSVFIVNFANELRRFSAASGLFEFIPVPGHTPASVAVGPTGRPWVVTSTGKVLSSRFFPRDESIDLQTAGTTSTPTTGSGDVSGLVASTSASGFTFSKNMQFTEVALPGGICNGQTFKDLSVGYDGTALVLCLITVIDTNLYRYNSGTKSFTLVTGLPTTSVCKADLDSEGRLWLLDGNVDGRVYRQKSKTSTAFDTIQAPVSSGASPFQTQMCQYNRDLVVGGDGTAYLIDSGGAVYRKTEAQTSFSRLVAGVWFNVAVGASNDVWLFDTDALYQLVNGQLRQRPVNGGANTTSMGGGADGSIYATQLYPSDSQQTLYKWNAGNQTFDRVNRAATMVDVSGSGRPWIVDPANQNSVYFAK